MDFYMKELWKYLKNIYRFCKGRSTLDAFDVVVNTVIVITGEKLKKGIK